VKLKVQKRGRKREKVPPAQKCNRKDKEKRVHSAAKRHLENK
jgi:hypothetical protein